MRTGLLLEKTYIKEQKEVFAKQIEIAKKYNQALIVHDREAHKDTFDFLTQTFKMKYLL